MIYLGNRQPPLDEVVNDPIVRIVIARDRLNGEEAQAQIEAARERFRKPLRYGADELGGAQSASNRSRWPMSGIGPESVPETRFYGF